MRHSGSAGQVHEVGLWANSSLDPICLSSRTRGGRALVWISRARGLGFGSVVIRERLSGGQRLADVAVCCISTRPFVPSVRLNSPNIVLRRAASGRPSRRLPGGPRSSRRSPRATTPGFRGEGGTGTGYSSRVRPCPRARTAGEQNEPSARGEAGRAARAGRRSGPRPPVGARRSRAKVMDRRSPKRATLPLVSSESRVVLKNRV